MRVIQKKAANQLHDAFFNHTQKNFRRSLTNTINHNHDKFFILTFEFLLFTC